MMKLHPGAAIALQRLSMDELGVARAIMNGDLTSPQNYENMALFAMRITGTGAAYRKGPNEYVWRDPAIYLNDEFLARCNGLMVVVLHPDGNSLTSQEFQERVVGSILLPYIKDDEVWGIAKIYDSATITMLQDNQLSTSPAVVFRDARVNYKTEMDDGSKILIEGKPSLLDHLAICEQGVWDKGGQPAGVATTLNTGGLRAMTEEEKKAAEMADRAKKDADEKEEKERADRARADADAGEALDKILKCVDSIGTRLDALERGRKDDDLPTEEDEIEALPERTAADKARKDAARGRFKARKDAEEAEEAEEKERADKARRDAEEDERMKSDKARRDAEEDEKEKERADRARKDSEDTRKRIADLERNMPKQLSDSDYAQMASQQAKADSVHSAFGDSAPRPLQGEDLASYRRRLADGLKRHSKAWKDVNLHVLPDSVMDIAEKAIYADAYESAIHPVDLPEGQLREIVTTDTTGRRISTFVGQPRAWMSSFTANRRRVAGIRNSGV